MQAMILAAGFGTRLLPYTRLRPKPLFPLLNEPLLLLTIKRLQHAGFDHIIVNCHYLREQIAAALDGLAGVVVQEEEDVLGTGGGLRMALAAMRDAPLLVTNGDIYHTVDYRDLYEAHVGHDTVVTMAMHDYRRFNKVTVRNDRVIGFDKQADGTMLAFTGLHVLDPEILEKIPEAETFSIIDRYRQLLQEGGNIQAIRVDGCAWTDMGTVDDYLALHGSLLQGKIPLWPEFSSRPENSFCIDPHVERSRLTLQQWACVGNVRLGAAPPVLRRCVVWDDVLLAGAGHYEDMLLAS